MPTLLTGSTSTDPTTAPTASGPAAGDAVASGAMDTALQALLNGIAWLRNQAALWSGGTFTGAVNGVTPTAAAHLVRKDYADGLLAVPAVTPATAQANWNMSPVSETPVAYWKDPTGLVHLRGAAQASAGAGNTPFILPAGVRPFGPSYFAVPANDSGTPGSPYWVALFSIDPTYGYVQIVTRSAGTGGNTPSANDRYHFDEISFRTT